MEKGAHRYIVLLSVILANVVLTGYIFGASRLQPLLIRKFKTTRSKISVIPATNSGVFNIMGLFCGCLVQRFGPKLVGLSAALLGGISISASFFATSVAHLIICQGVLLGFSTCIFVLSCSVTVSKCFHGKRLSMALSVVSCASSVCGMIYSYVLQLLSDEFGVLGTYLIVGAITFNAFDLALTWPRQETDDIKNGGKVKKQQKQNSIKQKVAIVLREKTFVLFAFGGCLALNSMLTSLNFFADMLADRQQEQFASLAIFMFNLVSVVGRLMPGISAQLKQSPPVIVPFIASGFALSGCLLVVFTESVILKVIASSLNGLAFGILKASVPVISVQLVGKQHIAPAMGFTMTITGIVAQVAGPINGYIRDKTGGYKLVYLCAAVSSCIGGLLLLVANFTRRRIQEEEGGEEEREKREETSLTVVAAQNHNTPCR